MLEVSTLSGYFKVYIYVGNSILFSILVLKNNKYLL